MYVCHCVFHHYQEDYTLPRKVLNRDLIGTYVIISTIRTWMVSRSTIKIGGEWEKPHWSFKDVLSRRIYTLFKVLFQNKNSQKGRAANTLGIGVMTGCTIHFKISSLTSMKRGLAVVEGILIKHNTCAGPSILMKGCYFPYPYHTHSV